MLNRFKQLLRGGVKEPQAPESELKPEGEEGIRLVGHREYVGGFWAEIGKLQFDLLVQQGLKPPDCFLDIACGSLRGGVHFIHYLDPGCYLGIDKERRLIDLGIEHELGSEAFAAKKPEFVVSDRFEFEKFTKPPRFALAQSLFTHLSPDDIHLCLGNLRKFVGPGHVFLVTFWEGDSRRNRDTSHSHAYFSYTRREMESFGKANGWKSTYIGKFNHPRDQVVMKYVLI
jgi:hypothetical protein